MARKVRHQRAGEPQRSFEIAGASQAVSGPSLARGVSLLYRRNRTNGAWVVKGSNGHGAYWTKRIADAVDFDEASGREVLTFFQAQDAAKRLARGDNGTGENAPLTVDAALTAYEADLKAIPTTHNGRACISLPCCSPNRSPC